LGLALDKWPVVILTGARQVGKSTLVQRFDGASERAYLTLDHLPTLARAHSAPEALVTERAKMTIDEVQRAPELMLAVKYEVDRARSAGRYLLAGSANLLLLRTTGESLAGRAHYLTLRGFTEREKRGERDATRWSALLGASDARAALECVEVAPAVDWQQAALQGGFPPAALAESASDRLAWFEDYTQTYLSRDLRELAQVDDLAGFGRLMQVAALRTGGVLNQADLARDAASPRTTVQRWMSLLVASYLVDLVPAFGPSRTRRLIKAPKVFPGDTGLALYLAGAYDREQLGRVPRPGVWLEALVLHELLAWSETQTPKPSVAHYRTESQHEIDFILEHGQRCLPIEVKASLAVRPHDASVIEDFCADHGERAPFGIVLYEGRDPLRLGPRSLAVPLGCVL
jgi:hypothetical protein